VKAGCGKTARPVWAADGGQRESIERASSDPTAGKPANKAEQSAAESVERRAGTKGNANQPSTCRTQSRISVSQALERIRQAFAVTHPRWEPYAGKPHVRFCAGGAR
jgi:hypothetical protein